MPTYVSTIKYTAQGIKGINDTTRRAASLKAAAKKMGVKIKDVYWTLGENDGLLILDAPDDESVTALLLTLGTLGNVQTSTVRAFTAAEMDKILDKVES